MRRLDNFIATLARLCRLSDHVVQVLSGVVIHEEPLFFEIAYVKPSNALTLFLTVKEISCDQYLDYINLKKSLPQAKA